MRIGLLGFGIVGAGVFELIRNRTDMSVVKVLLRRQLALPDVVTTQDMNDILCDDSIDTVVEAIGGLHPAFEYVKAALEAGKNVVTANKALVATYYDQLIPLMKSRGVMLRCTAAVGGGIGWLSELERIRRLETVSLVQGIMNGTCNYILHAMTSRNLSYEDALSQAQALGYAEADPTTDVEGIDTWHKLLLSCNTAFGVSMDANSVPVTGIQNIRKSDVDSFRKHGLVCKLIATGKAENGDYSAYVQPTLYPDTTLEAQVPANYNFMTLCAEVSGRKSFYGQGAGRYPTASNVLQDCIDLLEGKGFYCDCGEKAEAVNQDKLRYYVRAEADAWLDAHVQEKWEDALMTEPVTVSSMHNWLREHPQAFIAAICEENL